MKFQAQVQNVNVWRIKKLAIVKHKSQSQIQIILLDQSTDSLEHFLVSAASLNLE